MGLYWERERSLIRKITVIVVVFLFCFVLFFSNLVFTTFPHSSLKGT